jgi:hypothetical protein
MEFGRTIVKLGAKTANRCRAVIHGKFIFSLKKHQGKNLVKISSFFFTDIENFIYRKSGHRCWELIYYAIKPSVMDNKELYEHIFWNVLREADVEGLPVWSFVSDKKRADFLKQDFRFSDGGEGKLDGTVTIYGLSRTAETLSRKEEMASSEVELEGPM